MGALIGQQLSLQLFEQKSPRSAGAAAAGSWLGSVAGVSMGTSAATAAGVIESGALASGIVATLGLGAVGAVVGAGAAIALKKFMVKNFQSQDQQRLDRTSQYLERELHLFGNRDDHDPFDHLGVTLEFDDVGDDIAVTCLAVQNISSGCDLAGLAGSGLDKTGDLRTSSGAANPVIAKLIQQPRFISRGWSGYNIEI